MTFSEKVYRLRKAKGWTQEDLARRLDVSFVTINRWESGSSEPQHAHRREIEGLLAALEFAASGTEGSAAIERIAAALERIATALERSR